MDPVKEQHFRKFCPLVAPDLIELPTNWQLRHTFTSNYRKRYEGAVKDGGSLLSVHCDTSEQMDAAKPQSKTQGLTMLPLPTKRVMKIRKAAAELSEISSKDITLQMIVSKTRPWSEEGSYRVSISRDCAQGAGPQ
jgi:hypothetical protein